MLPSPSPSRDNADNLDEAPSSATCQPPAVPPRLRCSSVAGFSSYDFLETPSGHEPRPTSEPIAATDLPLPRPHRLSRVSVSYPRLCALCQDYIITPRCTAHQCSHCKALLHAACAKYAARSNRMFCQPIADGLGGTDQTENLSSVTTQDSSVLPLSCCSTLEQPLNQWGESQVAHWLTVVGLSRFVMLFKRKKVDGQFLLQIAPYSPRLNQVVDPFARQALRRAVVVLSGAQPAAGEELTTGTPDALSNLSSIADELNPEKDVLAVPVPATRTPGIMHNFQISSFTQEVACIVCGLPLLGLFRQGFQCQTCGMIIHRVCKALDTVPPCPNTPPTRESDEQESADQQETLNYSHLPRRLIPYKSLYFTVALEDQPLDSATQVPLFLFTCTNLIERIATDSLKEAASNPAAEPINLVDAYQQSATASRLSELHRTFACRLPSLESDVNLSEPLDVVRLAQLVKAFLRDLPDAVVPEQYYEDFCALATKINDTVSERSKAAHEFLAKLPQSHRICLCHVMKHLDFVLLHQRKLRDFRNSKLSDLQSGCLDSTGVTTSLGPVGALSSSIASRRMQDKQLTHPDNALLVFRQILVRPPWHLIYHIATQLGAHLQALNVVFHALATPEPNSSGTRIGQSNPAVLRPRLPPTLSCTYDIPSRIARSTTLYSEYGPVGVSTPGVPSTNKPWPTVDTDPTPASIERNKADLRNREWYWGDVTQTEVREIMDGLADGYFLVRDASSRRAGQFTLVVRWRGENKLNRIYHRGDYFGVVDPPPPVFRLVSELIDYCQADTLNRDDYAGMKLIWPVSHRHHRKFGSIGHSSRMFSPGNTVVSWSGNEEDRRIALPALQDPAVANLIRSQRLELKRARDDLLNLETKLKNIVDSMIQTMAKKEEAATLVKGEEKLREWLRAQSERLMDNIILHENPQISRQQAVINDRIHQIECSIESHKEEVRIKTEEYRALAEKQVIAILTWRKLRRKTQEIRRDIRNITGEEEADLDLDEGPESFTGDRPDPSIRGRRFNSHPRSCTPRSSTPDALSLTHLTPAFRSPNASAVLPPSIDIGNRSAWFVESITRDRAEELLFSKPTGTFLIRRATDGRQLALDVRLDSSVQHCLIFHENGKYGFNKSSCSFDSLEDLVRYYHKNSLKQHNPLLTTTLCYPVNTT